MMVDKTPDLDIRTVGNGPKRTTAWLDGVPCIVKGFTEWPKVGTKTHFT